MIKIPKAIELRFFNQAGFTLIELMLAMALFSTILIISTAGFVGLTKTFNRGVVRKQLSDGIQQATTEITKSLRENGSHVPIICMSSDPSCGPSGSTYNQLCFNDLSVRYIWQSPVGDAQDPDIGGLYKVSGQCTDDIPDSKQTLIDSRYFVRQLTLATTGSDLFQLQAMVTTAADGMLLKSDPLQDVCDGSANPASQTCAFQKVNLVISARNGGS